ncbi:MAG TPA: MFS transporter [Steroidobacteraceae bacterium]
MKPIAILFFICLTDVLGFGIIIPLLPYIGLRMGATPDLITPIMASYSLCQFIAAPIWGRLSDRFGRRPVLLLALTGLGLSYVMLAFATSIAWLLASRMFAGFMAGNLSAAMAYASDVTTPEERAKGLGLIGAAIGIGFALGPALGGILAGEDQASANFVLPALVSASLSLLALLGVWLLLPESHPASKRVARSAAHKRANSPLALLRRKVDLRWLVLAAVLVTVGHGILESIAAIWAKGAFGFGPRRAGLLILEIAVFAIIMQGRIVGLLVPRFGEKRIAISGIVIYMAGLAVLASVHTIAPAMVGLALCGVGAGAFTPCASALASKQAEPHERGAVLGTYQASSSLARIFGPAASGPLYSHVSTVAPFVAAMCALAPAIWFVNRLRSAERDRPAGG